MKKAKRATPTTVPQMRTASWVAARLGVSKVWVRKLREQGVLAGYLVGRNSGMDRGGRLLFRETDILAFKQQGVPVEEQRGAGQAGPDGT